MRRTLRVLLVAVVAVLAGGFAAAGPASAHVTVSPESAPQGGDTTLAFQVPCESDTAATVKVDVQFPTDHPIPGVALLPLAGWTAKAVTAKLPTPITTDDGTVTEAVTEVTWTANSTATGIGPGQFGLFTVLLGGLPKADRLVFKTVQSYSDGSVTSWIDVPVDGAPEPAHPAPVLKLSAGEPAAQPGASTSPGASAVPVASLVVQAGASSAVAAATATGTGSGTALLVAVVAVVLALAGLILGALALSRARSAKATTPAPPGSAPGASAPPAPANPGSAPGAGAGTDGTG